MTTSQATKIAWVTPMMVGRLGASLAQFRGQQKDAPKLEAAGHLIQNVPPAIRRLLGPAIEEEYGDLPHTAYAQVLGAQPKGFLRRTAPKLLHFPAAVLGGTALGTPFGVPGMLAGSLLGGGLSHMLQRGHEQRLNRTLTKESLYSPETLLFNMALASYAKEAAL